MLACVRVRAIRASGPDMRIDIVIVRENTEDLYAGVEYKPGSEEARLIHSWAPNKIKEDAAISIKPISAASSRRIVNMLSTTPLAGGVERLLL